MLGFEVLVSDTHAIRLALPPNGWPQNAAGIEFTMGTQPRGTVTATTDRLRDAVGQSGSTVFQAAGPLGTVLREAPRSFVPLASTRGLAPRRPERPRAKIRAATSEGAVHP